MELSHSCHCSSHSRECTGAIQHDLLSTYSQLYALPSAARRSMRCPMSQIQPYITPQGSGEPLGAASPDETTE